MNAPPILRGLDRWLIPYALQAARRRRHRGPVHLLLCIADHFEPQWGNVSSEVARQRVQHWVEQYPRSFSRFRDSDGRPPRHSFFFPIDQYDADHVDALAELCRQGFGEIEIHLHHDHDTADYEIYLWEVGTPTEKAVRLTYNSGNDRWPDIFIPGAAAP